MVPVALGGGEGIYGPVEFKEREQHLLETSAEFHELLVRRGMLSKDPQVTTMVERIGRQLAPPSTDPYLEYRFHVLDNPAPNAFALPDGQVYVHTGILALMENEAQLATLLAHEINHAAGHHNVLGYRSVRRKIITATVLSPVAQIVLGDYGDIGALITSYAIITAIYGYSQDLEEEADRRAVPRLLAAGYDIRESPRLFELMYVDHEGLRGRQPRKWSTHPTLPQRAQYLHAMAAEVEVERDLDGLRIAAESYRATIRDTALTTVENLILVDYPRTATVLARRLVEERPDARSHYALGEALRALGARPERVPVAALDVEPGEKSARKKIEKQNRKRALQKARLTRGEYERRLLDTPQGQLDLRTNSENARDAYSRALQLDPALHEARRGLGLALEDLGDTRAAAKELLGYLKARPDAVDRKLILRKLAAMKEAIAAEEDSDER